MNRSTTSARGLAILGAVALLPASARGANAQQAVSIVNGNSGMCLQPAAYVYQTQPGLTIVQQPCTGDLLQRWLYMYMGTGRVPGYSNPAAYYHFVNVRTGQCLDNRNGSMSDGGFVQQYPCNNTSTTMMWVDGVAGELRNARSGKCLDVQFGSYQPGAMLWQYRCTSTSLYNINYAQVFHLIP